MILKTIWQLIFEQRDLNDLTYMMHKYEYTIVTKKCSCNIFLAFFNLIPIPPLDGSKLLYAVLPIKDETKMILEQYGFFFLLIFIFLFSNYLGIFLFSILGFFLTYVVGIWNLLLLTVESSLCIIQTIAKRLIFYSKIGK